MEQNEYLKIVNDRAAQLVNQLNDLEIDTRLSVLIVATENLRALISHDSYLAAKQAQAAMQVFGGLSGMPIPSFENFGDLPGALLPPGAIPIGRVDPATGKITPLSAEERKKLLPPRRPDGPQPDWVSEEVDKIKKEGKKKR